MYIRVWTEITGAVCLLRTSFFIKLLFILYSTFLKFALALALSYLNISFCFENEKL